MVALVLSVTNKPVDFIVTLSKEEFPLSPPSAVYMACIHTYCIPLPWLDQGQTRSKTSHLLFMPRGKKLVPKIQQAHIVRSHCGFFLYTTLQVLSLATSKFSSFTKSKYIGCSLNTTLHWVLWCVFYQIHKYDWPCSVARTAMLISGSLMSLYIF